MGELDVDALRRLIAKTARALAKTGLVAATDGNISARLASDRFLVTPSGISKALITPGSILVCDGEGRRISGQGEVTCEVQLHLTAYKARPMAGGVVHAHPPCATALTLAGLDGLFRRPLIPEVAAQLGPIPTVPYATPGTKALAQSAEPLLRQSEVVVLFRHGALTTGNDPWKAFLRMEKLEHTAKVLEYAVRLAGSPQALKDMNDDELKDIFRFYGKPDDPQVLFPKFP